MTMVQRLFIAVLALCLAIPAIAMPTAHHAKAAVVAQDSHDCHNTAKQAPADNQGQSHDCIGCIARYDRVLLPTQSQLAPVVLPAQRLKVRLPQTRAGPDTPPPKA